MKYVSIDFEFKNTQGPIYDLVAAGINEVDPETKENKSSVYWLHQAPKNKQRIKEYLLDHRENSIFICFNADAEAKCFIALGINPLKFTWVDLQAEFRLITNHANKWRYGKQLIGGVEKTTYPNEAQYGEEDKRPHDRPEMSLVSCTYKMLGIKRELTDKKKMIGLILTGNYTQEVENKILDYVGEDIQDLYNIFKKIRNATKELEGENFSPQIYYQDVTYRGESCARAAMMSAVGYPVHREKLENFTHNAPIILQEVQKDILQQFPDMELFTTNKKTGRYVTKEAPIKQWIEDQGLASKWGKTNTGSLSLALENWEKHFHFRHDFPEGNFGAQQLRLKRIKQSLNGFLPKPITSKNSKTFKDSYGDDNRSHAYLKPYGAQSGRFQPNATGFLFLKSAWVRSLCEPTPGNVIVGIDYASQEFLLNALISEDKKMLASYADGDVYLHFAKLAGSVPWAGTKKEYKALRDVFKSTVLGVSYGMYSKALANKITQDTGKPTSEEEAQELIDLFYETYETYKDFIDQVKEDYEEKGVLRLPDGWTMWGDNLNERSVVNFIPQGYGSCILRKAIQLSQDAKLRPILPLHDALYIECKREDMEEVIPKFHELMEEAFVYYFPGQEEESRLIRLDVKAWGPGLKEEVMTIQDIEVECQEVYVDGRAKKEYEKFKKYFDKKIDDV